MTTSASNTAQSWFVFVRRFARNKSKPDDFSRANVLRLLIGSSGLIDHRFLRVEAEGRRTTSSSGGLRGAASDTRTCQKDIATQMAVFLAHAASVRTTGYRLATDNKGARYRPFCCRSNGAEGWHSICVRGGFNPLASPRPLLRMHGSLGC